MSSGKNLAALIKENKAVVIFLAVALLVLELQIFAVAALKSGEQYKLKMIDSNGNVIYETDGKNLSDFNKHYFEKVHGSLNDYQKKLEKQEIPFPFRAWFVAAVGIPFGFILCFGFVVKAYMALFYGEEKKEDEPVVDNTGDETRLGKIIGSVSRFNIFIIGALVFLTVIAYWIIPNIITYLSEAGIGTIVRFKWFFLALCVAIFGLVVWFIYLKYLIAKKAVESRVEVDKYRLQLEYEQNINSGLQLEYHQNEQGGKEAKADWDDGEVIDGEKTNE